MVPYVSSNSSFTLGPCAPSGSDGAISSVFFADLVPDRRDVVRRGVIAEINIDNRLPGSGFTFDIIEPRRFL